MRVLEQAVISFVLLAWARSPTDRRNLDPRTRPRGGYVRFGPDGALWLLNDARKGKLYRMAPAQ